jgi:hypothetical protein
LREAFYIKIDALVFGFVGDNTKKELFVGDNTNKE